MFAAIISLALWGLLIWAALGLMGCGLVKAGRVGEGGTVTYTEKVRVDRPPKEAPQVCSDGEPLHCCCDLSREGVISCRCPHPGGVQ